MMEKQFRVSDLWEIFKESYDEWNDDDAFTYAAAISYYAIFSLPAILIIIIHVAGVFMDKASVHKKLLEVMSQSLGSDTAHQIQSMVSNTNTQKDSGVMIVVGVIVLILSATSLLIQLQKALNKMWEVEIKKDTKLIKVLFDRTKTLGIILVVGFLLLMSIVINGILSALSSWIATFIPDFTVVIFHLVNFCVTFGIITCLFALIFKFLPDVYVQFRSVWVGAMVTAFLFMVGQYGMTLYFSLANPASAYGITGSIILILLWVYYSCLLLFFGAEFTQVYAKKYNQRILPANSPINI